MIFLNFIKYSLSYKKFTNFFTTLYSKIYRPLFTQEIEFISSHISQLLESKEEELAKLSKDTLYSILRTDDRKRYTQKKKIFEGITFSKDNEYDGIINYLRKKSNGQIENEINITASSIDSSSYQPRNITLFDDHNKHFRSQNEPNSWLCFDFKENRVIPNGYSIRTYSCGTNDNHPKSWVVECSNDNKSWETVDEEKNCPYLNGPNYSHTFTMNQQKSTKFRYIRMRLIAPNWNNNNNFRLGSFEIYCQFI